MRLKLTTPRIWKAAYVEAQIRLANLFPGPVKPLTEVEAALRRALQAEQLERARQRMAAA